MRDLVLAAVSANGRLARLCSAAATVVSYLLGYGGLGVVSGSAAGVLTGAVPISALIAAPSGRAAGLRRAVRPPLPGGVV